MHKKIESELVSLAHSILQMKNRDDILKLKEKAGQVYEKLSVLAFVERYAQSNSDISKSDLITSLFKEEIEESIIPVQEETSKVLTKEAEITISKAKNLKTIETIETTVKVIPNEASVKDEGLEELIEEVKDVDPYADVDLFSRKIETPTEEKIKRKVNIENTVVSEEIQEPVSSAPDMSETAERLSVTRKTINDTVVRGNLQIGLNDRIAFVKHLFEGSQEDFNRVVSQLNTLKTEKEAVNFVTGMVKLDYDWSGKEAYEERFISLITRKFA